MGGDTSPNLNVWDKLKFFIVSWFRWYRCMVMWSIPQFWLLILPNVMNILYLTWPYSFISNYEWPFVMCVRFVHSIKHCNNYTVINLLNYFPVCLRIIIVDGCLSYVLLLFYCLNKFGLSLFPCIYSVLLNRNT